jgi:hypothetical protein
VLFWSYIVMLVIAALVLGRFRGTPLRTHQWFLLGLGLSPLPVPAAMVVVGWILVLAWRRQRPGLSSGWFNVRQLILAGWTVIALGCLIGAITAGLLGQPDMQIEGNGSYRWTLQWFQDRTNGGVPRPWVVAVSMWWYRGAMLAWALWLAWSLIRWLPWAWQSFAAGGYWKKMFTGFTGGRGPHGGGNGGMSPARAARTGAAAEPTAAASTSHASLQPSPAAASQSQAWKVPARTPGEESPGWAGMPTPELGVRTIDGQPERRETMLGHGGSGERHGPPKPPPPKPAADKPGAPPPRWRMPPLKASRKDREGDDTDA